LGFSAENPAQIPVKSCKSECIILEPLGEAFLWGLGYVVISCSIIVIVSSSLSLCVFACSA
jgi:hypothetical protein